MSLRTAYHNLDIEFRTKGRASHTVTVRAQSGAAKSGKFSVPHNELGKIETAFNVARGPKRAKRRISSPEISIAKAFGKKLFASVFADERLAIFRNAVDEALSNDCGIRIRISTEHAPSLANLPWELLFDEENNRFVCQNSDYPLVRYLDRNTKVPELQVTGSLRILVLICEPPASSGLASLSLGEEFKELKQQVRHLEEAGFIELRDLSTASLAALQQELRRDQHGYAVLHIMGHAGFDLASDDGVIVMQDDDGNAAFVSSEQLGTVLDGNKIRLVVINACEGARASESDPYSGIAQTLMQMGIPAIIAMQAEISDDVALLFAKEFYSCLVGGYPVDVALAEARRYIFAKSEPLEWAIPVAYLRAEDSVLFRVNEDQRPRLSVNSDRAAASVEAVESVPGPFEFPTRSLKRGVNSVYLLIDDATGRSEYRRLAYRIAIVYDEACLSLGWTDGYVLAFCQQKASPANGKQARFSAVVHGLRLLNELDLFSDDGNIRISEQVSRTREVILSDTARVSLLPTTPGTYPDLQGFVRTSLTISVEVDTGSLQSALQAVADLPRKKNDERSVRLSITGNNVNVFSQSRYRGKTPTVSSQLVAQNHIGADVVQLFDLNRLMPVIKKIESETIKIEAAGPLSPCRITPMNDDSMLLCYMVMPLRPTDEELPT